MAQKGIEPRPIVGGDFLRCDAIRSEDYSVHDGTTGAEYIHENGFYVGNHASEIRDEIDGVLEVFDEMAPGPG